MSDNRLAAQVLAAQELSPAEPSDLTGILLADEQRQAFLTLCPDEHSTEFTTWLCDQLERDRIIYWQRRLDRLADESEVRVLLAHEAGYPARLASCWDRPPLLFVEGTLRPTPASVAVVGSRMAGESTLQAAYELARRLAQADIAVVSGLAAGVDTAAHRGALAGGGQTIAVMGTGITRVFPESNRDLTRRIARDGALLSQFVPDAPRTATTFLRRNNIIAGLADVSVVIDGQERSGSRHQSEQAVRYGRSVLLWSPTLFEQSWAQQAVQRGEAAFVADVEDILARLGADS